MKSSQALVLGSLLLALAATAMASVQQQDFFILLEDGTRLTYGDLRAMAGGGNCCFPAKFTTAVTYSSSNRIRLFIAQDKCDPGFEINSSAYPSTVKAIDLCAQGCDPNKGCGLNGMNTKGVSTAGGKWPINEGQQCAYSDGRVMQDKTCRAITKDNVFQYRLLCKQDCNNVYTCQQPSFDKSKCAGSGSGSAPVMTYVNLGQACGYTQDNKQYVCGGNHVSCTNGVCVSSFPGK